MGRSIDQTEPLVPGLMFTSEADAERFLRRLTNVLPLLHVTYLAGGERLPFVLTTYPAEWCDRYRERDYIEVDPVVRLGLDSMSPFDWIDVPKDRAANALFQEARPYIGTQGYSIPVPGARRGLLTVTSDLPRPEWNLFLDEQLAQLVITAIWFHHAVEQMRARLHLASLPKLTPREIEALKWASEGKTIWETSQILGIGQRTVETYLVTAASKLGARNKTQAAATAKGFGLI